MQTRHSSKRRTHTQPSKRLVATIQPRSWGNSPQPAAQLDESQPARHDFSHVDLFAHDPGPRSVPNVLQSSGIKTGSQQLIQRQPSRSTVAAPASIFDTAIGSPNSPPVLFGIDTTTRQVYASVAVPGRSMLEIATYIYGSADKAAELQAKNGVPAMVPPGRNLILVEGTFTQLAHQAISVARRNGTILQTDGVSTGTTEAQPLIYRFSAAGQTFELTESQMRGMLQGLGGWISRKARGIFDEAESGRDVHRDFLEDTNSVVRGISDWFADQDELSVSIWNKALTAGQEISDILGTANFATGEITNGLQIIPEQAQRLEQAAAALDDAKHQWHNYIEGTIGGASVAVHRLEIVRNVSFGIAAGLAGAVVAPAIFAAAGTSLAGAGITGTAATVLSGTAAIGTGALAGGTLQGALNVVAPGAQADQSIGDRFTTGFQQGALAGGLGAAGALAAPGVSGALSQRLYGAAPTALTTFGARAAVSTLTGAAIGAPLAATGAAVSNIGALARGEITPVQYLERIAWGTLEGATFGAAFGFLGSALSRESPTALVKPTPGSGGSGAGAEADFILTAVEVNAETGVISRMALHRPTGQYFRAQFNPITGNGEIINLSTGQPVGTISNGQFNPPAAALLASNPSGGAATTAATTGEVPNTGQGLVPIQSGSLGGSTSTVPRGTLGLPAPPTSGSSVSVPQVAIGSEMSSGGYKSTLQGKEHGVFLGRIPGVGQEVAIKIYPKNHRKFMQDLNGAKVAESTGMGPHVYGEIDIDPSKQAFAMDIVEGGFVDAAGGATAAEQAQAAHHASKVNQQTIQDIKNYSHQMLTKGHYYHGEVQGFVDDFGRWRPIDFQPITKLPAVGTPEYAEALDMHNDMFKSEIKLLEGFAAQNGTP